MNAAERDSQGESTTEARCACCSGFGTRVRHELQWKLVRLSVVDVVEEKGTRDVLLHPICIPEYLDANPELALTSRRDVMVEATERMAGETSSELHRRQSAARIRDAETIEESKQQLLRRGFQTGVDWFYTQPEIPGDCPVYDDARIAKAVRELYPQPSIDDERGYPGVESLGVPFDL